ncbi:MAG: mannose-6-phosphate isomerase [Prolixibacteraceae bacterium]|jgi:mannose-6-phosphate isomerase|nr:mannose-6-phosphate isomerase [Prolixibacteraceae bacterium]
METLYPLKFVPFYKEKIWGGDKIKTVLNKDFGNLPNCGESWEISAVEGNISVVANGYLAGNDLQELAEIYMGDLLGEKIYERFGLEFPLLIKFIDANDDLSIQVHPDDNLSKQRHHAYGKTEMWYVLQSDKGAKLNSGFNQVVDKEKYLEFLEAGNLMEILNFEEVLPGDVFFIPAGRVHAIGKGILLTEIQQTSDVTYRIYDYDRRDDKGNTRELHTDLALGAIDFSLQEKYKTDYKEKLNESSEIVSCEYFTTNVLSFNQSIEKDYNNIDSFVIYICLEGNYEIAYEGGTEMVSQGETVLIPAALENLKLIPKSGAVKLLEVYIE